MRFDWLLERYPAEQKRIERSVKFLNDETSFDVRPLSNGLDIKLVRGHTKQEPLTVHAADASLSSPLSLVIPLAPSMHVDIPGIKGPIQIAANTHFWHLPGEPWANYHVAKGQQILTAAIGLTPEFIAKLAPEQKLCAPLDSLREDGSPSPFLVQRRSGPALRDAVTQLFNNPYQGHVGQLFAEGKAMEIIAIALDTLQLPDRAPYLRLSQWEIHRIREAKERLTMDLRFPPSSRELAQAAGLSIIRFERGFREVYGAPIFRWLQNYKLELAYKLLQQESLSIKEIAFRLGYSHPANFTNAFRRRFGEPPGAIRRK